MVSLNDALEHQKQYSKFLDWISSNPQLQSEFESLGWKKDTDTGLWFRTPNPGDNRSDYIDDANGVAAAISDADIAYAKNINDGQVGALWSSNARGVSHEDTNTDTSALQLYKEELELQKEAAAEAEAKANAKMHAKGNAMIADALSELPSVNEMYAKKLAGLKQEYDAAKNRNDQTFKGAEKLYKGNVSQGDEDWRIGENTAINAAAGSQQQAQQMLSQFGNSNSARQDIAKASLQQFDSAQSDNNTKYGANMRQWDSDYNLAKQQKDIDDATAYDKYKTAEVTEQESRYKNLQNIYNNVISSSIQNEVGDAGAKEAKKNLALPDYNWQRKDLGKVAQYKPKNVSTFSKKQNIGVSNVKSKY